jgi:hypothetical protein
MPISLPVGPPRVGLGGLRLGGGPARPNMTNLLKGLMGGGAGGGGGVPVFGGGGGGGASGSGPGGIGGLYATNTMNSSTQQDPALAGLAGEMKSYQDSLAAGNDRDAVNALQRQRDMASGQMKEFQAIGGRRGMGPGSGASNLLVRRGLDEAGRQQTGLNAQLTSDARRQQGSMLGQRGQFELGTAGVNLGQQQFGLAQWQAQQQAQLAQAQLDAMRNNQMWSQMMGLLNFAV